MDLSKIEWDYVEPSTIAVLVAHTLLMIVGILAAVCFLIWCGTAVYWVVSLLKGKYRKGNKNG